MSSSAAESALPFGKQFSPTQTPLAPLVALILTHQGDRAALEEAIRDEFFGKSSQPDTMAMNAFLAVRAYGLLEGDDSYEASALALELATLTGPALSRRFALHILTDKDIHGLTVLQTALSLKAVGQVPTIAVLGDALRDIGVDPGGQRSEKVGTIRGWLAEAGVVKNDRWDIDEDVLQEILGPSLEEIEALELCRCHNVRFFVPSPRWREPLPITRRRWRPPQTFSRIRHSAGAATSPVRF